MGGLVGSREKERRKEEGEEKEGREEEGGVRTTRRKVRIPLGG